MIRFLVIFTTIATAILVFLADESGAMTLALLAAMTAVAIVLFRRQTESKDFLTYLFLVALCIRLIAGVAIHVYEIRDFVGPDAHTYDFIGSNIADYWLGLSGLADQRVLSIRGPGWGMHYLMGSLYFLFGKYIFLAQSFCGFFGAATIPAAYLLAGEVFKNERVARFTAVAIAFFPAFIIWSSQLLKDGLIVFLLVLCMLAVMRIQKRFTVSGIALLIVSLACILSLRFYIFYMVGAAVASSFVIGTTTSMKATLQRTAMLFVVGLALTYLGVIRTASGDLATYGSLDRVQVSRADLGRSDTGGYSGATDVSTVGGAISAIPKGFVYLMLAPFPWEIKNLRQSLTLPDILLWWSMIPFMIYGGWYAIKNRLRTTFPILVFTGMLTLMYSIFQGNIGAAYRQRTQIQVFLFIFVGVGIGIILEKRADRKAIEEQRRQQMRNHLKANLRRPQQV